jgi:hypothetical protein
VRFLSVVAGSDNLVVPRVFGVHEEVVRIPDLGHFGLLFSPRVFGIVADRLREARPPFPRLGQTPDPVV